MASTLESALGMGEGTRKIVLRFKECFDDRKNIDMPGFRIPFRLQTDASATGLGVVLAQTIDDKEYVIACGSRLLTNAERNYSVKERYQVYKYQTGNDINVPLGKTIRSVKLNH